MKKAVIVGGSNGIGLAIANKFIEKDYHTIILDRVSPDESATLKEGSYTYHYCDLLDYDEAMFESLSKDDEIEALMITAGFGRVADFEYLHNAEIDNMFKVNTAAGIKIIRSFYDKIKSEKPFYCGIMGSIAGLVSSPMFSVYAASKAAVCRFTESVNVELEAFGTSNRILNVS
ncbi:MAG: SDR family NAD(P)-dependent oxidoreductase, partial [Ruminiclostridium sp.]|nr:SDR family NAD(P)-dependent oxidoreductase [Ruminiclostridium sp.]